MRLKWGIIYVEKDHDLYKCKALLQLDFPA